MGLDKAAVSRSVALLQERGFLKSRPLGLRKVEYATTPAGRKQHDRTSAWPPRAKKPCWVASARKSATH